MSARTALNSIKLAARQVPKGQRAYSLLTGAKAAAAVAPRTASLTVSFNSLAFTLSLTPHNADRT